MDCTMKKRALFMITNAGFADEIIGIARSQGAKGATILNARGEGAHHKVFMGITVDSEKEIILCIVDAQTADRIMSAVKEQAGITTPAHCVCFTLSINKVIGMNLPTPKQEESGS